MLAESLIETQMGPMVAIADAEGLILLEFTNRRMLPTQRKRVEKLFGGEIAMGENDCTRLLKVELDDYFAGKLRVFTTPLRLDGTAFQMAHWRALLQVPYGQTATYAEMAAKLGRPNAPRAAARANGDNRIAILVPCHRIVGSSGELCGYGGGLHRKRALIELECKLSRKKIRGNQKTQPKTVNLRYTNNTPPAG